jgi:hypothetical protein
VILSLPRGVGGVQMLCEELSLEQQAKGIPTFRLPNEAKPLKPLAKKLVE